MYRQLTLDVCGPSFSKGAGCSADPHITYKVMLPFRGENPTAGQSRVRPSEYLITQLPNPTIAGPHITGSSPVTDSNISRARNPSARRTSFSTPLKNFSTLASVGLVLTSALPIMPSIISHPAQPAKNTRKNLTTNPKIPNL